VRKAVLATILLMASSGVAAGEPGHPASSHQGEQRRTGLALSDSRQAEIEAMRKGRRAEMARLNRRLVALEAKLADTFVASTATHERLGRLLDAIAWVERDLRVAHLAALLETPDILPAEPIQAGDDELAGFEPAAGP